ncbi:unnamed protein product [Moneuplotes crassus]|uniref:TRP C-terminal domain-containing protein n=1 Tax=Euplotes crassus TaxID=5936 RepID=A0AAD1Y941_EUPCR|nr:unnamed protein product [Moneuplotes crassus]
MKVKSYAFRYNTFTNIDVVNGISCPDNSCVFLTSNGFKNSWDRVSLFRFDSSLNMVWEFNLDDNIAKNGIALHSSGSNLVLVTQSTAECLLVKLDSATRSIVEQLKIGSATDCDSLTFSDDYSSIYVSGKVSSSPHVFKIGYADFGTTSITSIPIGMDSVYSIHSYVNSGQELVMISGAVTSPTQSYSLVSVNYDTATQQWAKKLDCPTSCVLTGTNEALVLESDNKIVSYFLDTKPIIYVSNLADGALVGSYVPDFTQSNLEISSIAYSASFSKVFVLMKYDSGAYKLEYDPAIGSFSNAYVSTAIRPGWILEAGGHTLIGSGVHSDADVMGVSRLASNGETGINTDVAFTSTSNSFVVSSGYPYSNDATSFVSAAPGTVTKATSNVGINNLPSTKISNTLDFESEVVFKTKNYVLDTSVGATGNIPNFFPCSISGSTSISSVIDPHSNGQPKPSWITIGGDLLSFDYAVPSSAGGQTFYFTGKSTVDGQTYLQDVQINVATNSNPSPSPPPNPSPNPSPTPSIPSSSSSFPSTCGISNCKTCSSSECTACQDGYILTSSQTCEVVDGSLNLNSSLVIAGFAGAMTTTTLSGVLFQSSSQNMWAMLNQYQLFMVIPFLRSDLPLDFRKTIKALQTSILNINILNTKSLPGFQSIIEQLDYENPYTEFRDNEYESGSAFVNCFDLIVTLVGSAILGLCMHLALKLVCTRKNSGFQSKFYSYFVSLFYFKLYLRFFLESFLFVCLVCMSEVFRADKITASPLSYYISLGIIIILLLLMLLVVILFCMLLKPHENKYVKELFEGFKINNLAQLQNFTFLTRRFLVVTIIVMMRSAPLMSKLFIYALLQLASLMLTVIVRPHDEKCSNIIEIVNEVTYFCTMVLVFCTQKIDSIILDELLNNSIVCNTAIIAIISAINLVYESVKYIYSKRERKRVQPLTKRVTVHSSKYLNTIQKDLNASISMNQHEDMRPQNVDTTKDTSKEFEISPERKLQPREVAVPYRMFKKSKFAKPKIVAMN